MQSEARLPTPSGRFTLQAYAGSETDPAPDLALIAEGMNPQEAVTVRIHSECITGDVFGSSRCDCGEQLTAAIHRAGVDKGVVIYLRQEGRGIGLISKLKAYNLQDLLGLDTLEANTHLGFEADSRQYEAAVFILQSLGIRNVRLMTNNPEKMSALTHSGILVTERIPIEIAPNPENTNYLQTKKSIMGHLLKQGSFL